MRQRQRTVSPPIPQGRMVVGDLVVVLDENGEPVIEGEVMAFTVQQDGRCTEISMSEGPRISWLRKHRRWKLNRRERRYHDQSIERVRSGEWIEICSEVITFSEPTGE